MHGGVYLLVNKSTRNDYVKNKKVQQRLFRVKLKWKEKQFSKIYLVNFVA